MAKTTTTTRNWTLVSSALAGPAAHYEQLQQLLEAPDPYWKAQTPIAFRPVARFSFDPARTKFQELAIDPRATLGHIDTLLVLMAARMPGLSIQLRVAPAETLAANTPADVSGVRLVRGKLELGRGAGSDLTWQAPPHHSTLIGKK